MSEFPVPDTLVLKIEERETGITTSHIDTTLYILYDKKDHNYVIRGRRRFAPNQQSCEYSFVTEDVEDLIYFITFVICKKNLWTYVLYNYDNLPIESNEITFDFLYSYDHSDYELAAYDNQKFSKSTLRKNLEMLRNVFNYYN
jgi:hypothetical protein